MAISYSQIQVNGRISNTTDFAIDQCQEFPAETFGSSHKLEETGVNISATPLTIPTSRTGFTFTWGIVYNHDLTNKIYVGCTVVKADGSDDAIELPVLAGQPLVMPNIKAGTDVTIKCATGLTATASWSFAMS